MWPPEKVIGLVAGRYGRAERGEGVWPEAVARDGSWSSGRRGDIRLDLQTLL